MSSLGVRGQWSDGETWALIEAWGPRHLHRNGGSLDTAEWDQVCNAVNAHRAAAGDRFNRSVVQCQKRVYTLRDQFKKEVAKGWPTSGWRHFAQLRAFLLAGPPAYVKEEEVEEEKEEVGVSGSVGRRTVPTKRHFSSLQDGPPPGFPPKKAKEEPVEEEKVKEEEVEGEGEWQAHVHAAASASAGCLPGAVVTKLAEVYQSVEMERLSVEKEKLAMEWEKRAAKIDGRDRRRLNTLTHGTDLICSRRENRRRLAYVE